MLLDSSGNLGLGVTPSAWDISLRFLEMPYGVGYGANTGIASVYVVSNAFYSSGSWKYKTSDEATYYQQINGQQGAPRHLARTLAFMPEGEHL